MSSYSTSHHDLLLRASETPELKALLENLEKSEITTKAGSLNYFLTHTTSVAWPFIAASLLLRFQPTRSVWLISHNIRAQEHFFSELSQWLEPLSFFPDLGMTANGMALPDPEVVSERLACLSAMARGDVITSLITARDLSSTVPSKKELLADVMTIGLGWKGSPGMMAQQLEKIGFERTSQVAHRGEYALRGGILDFFAWQESFPCRLEFGEEGIDSIRVFDPDSQVSLRSIESCDIQSTDPDRQGVPLSHYVSEGDLVLLLGDDFKEEERALFEQLPATKIQLLEEIPHEVDEEKKEKISLEKTTPSSKKKSIAVLDQEFSPYSEVLCSSIPCAAFSAGDFVMQEGRRKEFFKQLHQWQSQGYHFYFFSSTEGGGGERFLALAESEGILKTQLSFCLGGISEGFVFPRASLVVLSEAEIFGRSAQQRWRHLHRKREEQRAARSMIDYTEFEEGDFVVHADYGIGHYEGIQRVAGVDGVLSEVLVLGFEGDSKLFVPLDQAWQLSRYVGVGKAIPTLSSLGSDRWKKMRGAAEKSVFLYAGKLLKLQAERETGLGHAFGPDTPWQKELEEKFPYRETADQLRAIAEIKQDMESPQAMDRLLCGDVGFGKTEVALRAAFKAVLDGKQVAFLAPTTVLAQQHAQTLKERMSAYPARIELLCRYRTAAEQRDVVKGLGDGSVDIVIGTHRLLSADIIFKDLGLVIIDEEQRFGVKHKEAFKDRFRLVDMLTLSATPIPRTLYLSLMGARKMSLLETPPAHRQSIDTIIGPYDERVIKQALEQELARGGQIYFLHNRIGTIEKVAGRLQELVPSARIAIGHGQMPEGELEGVMQRFIQGEADVLVSTTIIESGLDIPNANTIIIDRADLFGLADLYQLRGRVGRSQQKAYAYLLLPRDVMVFGEARRRVQAIRQYSDLGAGFKIAMRDLEIRGAGNLLGTAQSGHIAAIGFDLYCKMLHQAVAQMKGETPQSSSLNQSALFLDFVVTSSSAWVLAQEAHALKEKETGKKFAIAQLPAFIPEEYLPEVERRLEIYRQLAVAPDRASLEKLEVSWRDRFGPLPMALHTLVKMEVIRRAASEHGVSKVETRGDKLILTRQGGFLQLGSHFPRLTSWKPESKLTEILSFLDSLK